jgi:glycerol-3-phosphate dehydrogenase
MSVRWTMGRLVAEHAIDLACQKLGAQTRRCATATTPVHGGDMSDKGALLASLQSQAGPGAPAAAIAHLADTFGSSAPQVLLGGSTLLPNAEIFEAEVRYAARNEMVETLADLVLRRLDLGSGSEVETIPLTACARIAGTELGWDAARQSAEIARVRASYPFASPASQQA